MINFEQSCIFDPALDLGYFIAKLISAKRKYNLPLDVEEVLEKRFLDKYTAKISAEPLKTVGFCTKPEVTFNIYISDTGLVEAIISLTRLTVNIG